MARWYDKYLVSDTPHHDGAWGGRQRIYKFENGYGASVVPEYIDRVVDEYEDHENPERPVIGDLMPKKGFWEIAPWDNDKEFIGQLLMNWSDDVLRHQSDPDIDNVLGQISRL